MTSTIIKVKAKILAKKLHPDQEAELKPVMVGFGVGKSDME